MQTQLFMYCYITKQIGPKGGVCRQLNKIFLLPPPTPLLPVVYATDHSKTVVPGLFLFCVAL